MENLANVDNSLLNALRIVIELAEENCLTMMDAVADGQLPDFYLQQAAVKRCYQFLYAANEELARNELSNA